MNIRQFTAAALLASAGAALLPGCPSDPQPLKLQGQVSLTLLHTSDIHSRLFPYDFQVSSTDAALGLGTANTLAKIGGAARVSHIVQRERARADRVLHLDGGDCFQGAPVFNFYNGEAELRALTEMGTDAMIISNHEFDKGALNLSNQLQKWASYPVLAANYKFDEITIPGSPQLAKVVVPWTSFNLNGLKVGVIGMGNLSSLSSLFEQPNRLGIMPMNTTTVAQFYTDLIRPLVDVVVFVTHLGLEVDEEMIRNTSGIDIVLGGHNHIALQPPKVLEDCQNVDEKGNHFINIISPDAQESGSDNWHDQRRCTARVA
ncbi:MAG: metallophosphatase [Polyangiaceae bacterium]